MKSPEELDELYRQKQAQKEPSFEPLIALIQASIDRRYRPDITHYNIYQHDLEPLLTEIAHELSMYKTDVQREVACRIESEHWNASFNGQYIVVSPKKNKKK